MPKVDVTPFGSRHRQYSDAIPARPRLAVPAVPESITRADYVAWIESLGFDVKNLKSMELSSFGVTAVVYATDDQGRKYTIDGETAATHVVTVRVDDT